MTAFEDFVNLELPRRAAYLNNSIASYDADPNLNAAPAIISGAPIGSQFLEETRDILWRKNGRGFWEYSRGSVFGAGDDIYVETTGDDGAPGTSENPIASLEEAFSRMPILGGGLPLPRIQLGIGTFAQPDYKGTDNRLQFSGGFTSQGAHAQMEGTLIDGIVGGSVNVTGWVANLATVTDTLVVDELRGKLISVRTSGSGNESYLWILSNTVNTILVAVTTVAHGGFTTPETGARLVKDLGTKIVRPASNPTAFENTFYTSDKVELRHIHFDGAINGAGTTAIWTNNNSDFSVTRCKFTDQTYGVILSGPNSRPLWCWWEDISVAAISNSSNGMDWSGDHVVINIPTVIASGVTAHLNIGAGAMRWLEGVTTFATISGSVQDWSVGLWVIDGGTLPTYLSMTGASVRYNKGNLGFNVRNGSLSNHIVSTAGGHSIDFAGLSATTVMPTGNYINDNGVAITLADYLAGTGAATDPLLFASSRGSFYYD